MNTASKIVKLLKLEYLENIDEALILNPKIIGNSTDLEEIYRKTIDASCYLSTEIDFIFHKINTIKSTISDNNSTYYYKKIFPDSFSLIQKKITEKQIRKYLIDLFLAKKLHEFDGKERGKGVLEILTEIVNYKKELGLSHPFATFDDLKDRTDEIDLQAELNRLAAIKRIRFEKKGENILFYLP